MATLEETFLTSWTASSKENCFSDLIHSQVGGLTLFYKEFLFLARGPYLKVNDYELTPDQRYLSDATIHLQTILCSAVPYMADAGTILLPQNHDF